MSLPRIIHLILAVIFMGLAIFINTLEINTIWGDLSFALAIGFLIAAVASNWKFVFTSILAFILLCFAGVGVQLRLENTAPRHQELYKYCDIVAVKDSTKLTGSLSGGIFVVNGVINEQSVYYFYAIENGGYVLKNIPAENVTVYEDTVDTGYITSVYDVIDTDYFNKYQKKGLMSDDVRMKLVGYQIHIPPNSITRQFNLDLSK
jgi:membrane protein implicated in regulation of membrane protease activity